MERAGHWGTDRVTGTNLQPWGGFKPLPMPGQAAPTLPVPTMRLLSLLLLLGLCCLWARLVSTGEHGVGTGTLRDGVAGGSAAACKGMSVAVAGVQHPAQQCHLPTQHAAEVTRKPPDGSPGRG